MAYRSLLVLLEQDPLDTQRTGIAIRLARELDCHLVGLAPTGTIDLSSGPRAAGALAEFAALAWDQLREQAVRTGEAFSQRCRTANLASSEIVVDESDRAASLLRHAHCSDLVLLTQADPALPGHAQLQEMVEQVVLRSARPVLILPHAGRRDSLGSHVLVAWDDSAEAARAVADAMPLLARAQKVSVVRWRRPRTLDGDAAHAPLDALRRWLGHHGVQAEMRVESSPSPIADAMLSFAADHDIDLIVMGAYGHTRWSERLLGGATRGMLRSMTVPVLMSH